MSARSCPRCHSGDLEVAGPLARCRGCNLWTPLRLLAPASEEGDVGLNGNGKEPAPLARLHAPVLGEVPVLGKEYEVCDIHPVVAVRCRCEPGVPAFLIMGMQGGTSCRRCGRLYFIQECTMDRATGAGSVVLGINKDNLRKEIVT